MSPWCPVLKSCKSASAFEQNSNDAVTAGTSFSFGSVPVTFQFCGAGVSESIEHPAKSDCVTCETIFANVPLFRCGNAVSKSSSQVLIPYSFHC
jgi:hypothetical protein